MSYAAALSSSGANFSHPPRVSNERKFNVVMYGIDECPEGMKKPQRDYQDNESVVNVINSLDSSLDKQSVRDCFRMGKYSKEKCRPILVKLACASNASSVLSNRRKLSESEKYNKISVKRDMSKLERQEESVLLKERFTLIRAGALRKDLKIRGNQLFVKNKVVGSVVDMKYVPADSSSTDNVESPTEQSGVEQSSQPFEPIITSLTSHVNQSSSHQSSTHIHDLHRAPLFVFMECT